MLRSPLWLNTLPTLLPTLRVSMTSTIKNPLAAVFSRSDFNKMVLVWAKPKKGNSENNTKIIPVFLGFNTDATTARIILARLFLNYAKVDINPNFPKIHWT